MSVKKNIFATYLFVAPAGIVMLLGLLYPLVMAFQLSFFDWSMGTPWDSKTFVGLDWFSHMMTDDAVWESFWVTLRFGFWVVTMEMILGTFLALLLEKPIKGASFFRTLFILPLMISPVVVGLIWRYLFDARAGMINYYLGVIGIEPVLWLASPEVALTSLIISDIWQWTPFIFIIVLAGLQALPSEVIEASRIDGANWWQSTLLVKLPMIRSVLLIALLMRIIDVYKVVEVEMEVPELPPPVPQTVFTVATPCRRRQ